MILNKRKTLEAARKFAQRGARDKALKEYQKLIKADPRDAKLRLELGDALRRFGQTAEAVDAYAKVAQQYTAEGFDARAVAVYRQIQVLDAERFDCYEPLAELYQRMGLVAEAVNALQTAAEGFQRQGRRPDALALLRKMAALDPSNTASRVKVADLLRHERMHAEAIAEYEAAARELERQGDAEAAEKVYGSVLELEPERADVLARLAQNLLGRGLAERAEPYASRAVKLGPDVPEHYELLAEAQRQLAREDAMAETYRSLAELYRRRGDGELAREITQRFVASEAFSVEESARREDAGPELLLEEPLGDDELLLGDDLDEESVPGEPALFGSPISFDAEPAGRAARGLYGEDTLEEEAEPDASGPSLLDEDYLADEPLLHEDESGIAATFAALPQPAAARPSRAGAPEAPLPELPRMPPAPASTADAEQLLAEASVYLRYGKRDRAIANLEQVLALDPDQRDALEKLGEALAESGEPARAAELWLRAARLARGEGDEAGLRILRDRIAALDAAAAASLDAESGAALSSETELDLGEIELDLEAGSEGAELAEAVGGLAGSDTEQAFAGEGASFGRESSASASQQFLEDLEEAEFYLQQGLRDEAETIYKRLLEVAPHHPRALVRLGEIAAARGEDPSAASGPGGAGGLAAAEAPAGGLPGLEERDRARGAGSDLGAELDDFEPAGPGAPAEVELLGDEISQESLEALVRSADLEAAGLAEPGDEAAEESTAEQPAVRLDELGNTLEDLGPFAAADEEPFAELAAAAPAAPLAAAPAPALVRPPEPAPAPAGDFDLAAELSEALDEVSGPGASGNAAATADDGFASVFRDFKKGVSASLSAGDHEAHYDLGIAYREMGLLEDAMSELRAAAESPARRVDGLHMLSQCALALGRPAEAVAQLEQALAAAGLTREQTLAVRFELGRAFEGVGDLERARESWELVASLDPLFRDVEAQLVRLDEIRKPAAPPVAPAAAAAAGSFEAFESFEDVIAEAAAEADAPLAPPAAAEPAEREPEPEPEWEPAPEEKPEPEAPARRRKRISFV